MEKFHPSPYFLIDWGEDVNQEIFNIFPPSTSTEKKRDVLRKKLQTPDLFQNLFSYSLKLREFYTKINNELYAFDKSDEVLFKIVIENLIVYLNLNKETFLGFSLYKELYHIFIVNLIWKRKKSLLQIKDRTPGIYIIYNKVSFVTYVGESYNMEKRFFDHWNSLNEGRHSNKNLQRAVNESGLENFYFFVADYGEAFKENTYRRKKETDFINSWPGSIYNIKNTFSRKNN